MIFSFIGTLFGLSIMAFLIMAIPTVLFMTACAIIGYFLEPNPKV